MLTKEKEKKSGTTTTTTTKKKEEEYNRNRKMKLLISKMLHICYSTVTIIIVFIEIVHDFEDVHRDKRDR